MSKTRAEELPIWESQVTRGWHYSVETHGMLCGTITMRTKPCTFPNDHGRLIFEATYKTALTNTFVLTQRLREVRYRPRPHQPLSAGRAAPLPAPSLQKASKRLPQHAPVTGKHTQLRFSLRGWATWSCEQGYHVVWRSHTVAFFVLFCFITTSSLSLLAQ